MHRLKKQTICTDEESAVVNLKSNDEIINTDDSIHNKSMNIKESCDEIGSQRDNIPSISVTSMQKDVVKHEKVFKHDDATPKSIRYSYIYI